MEKNTLKIKALLTILFLWAGISTAQAQSLYADNKANNVGDIITVILQENISGSTNSDAENTSTAGAGTGGSVSGNFLPFEPTFGSDVQVNYNSDQQVTTNQGQLLEGYMSVEVTEITENGNLVVEGSRSTEINGELHKIDLKGLVRPRDVNGHNQIFSYQVGNAKINYEKQGGLKEVTKKEGFLKRAALAGLGVALGTVAVLKAMK